MDERDLVSEERGGGIFAPDTLLPSQYFDRVRARAGHDAERRLMIAVLEDGVLAYLKNLGADDPRRRELFLEAEEWVESRDTGWLYAFENVCDVLDLDADYIRRGLHERKRRASWTTATASPAEDAAKLATADELPEELFDEPRLASGMSRR